LSAGFQELFPAQLTVELENVAVPLLVEQLRSREVGHCMRIGDLDVDLMIRLCARLRAELPTTTVVVLTNGTLSIPAELAVTSTKLVELRNPSQDFYTCSAKPSGGTFLRGTLDIREQNKQPLQ
jgi:DNA phosphorothioation-dependent restriction protein DptH